MTSLEKQEALFVQNLHRHYCRVPQISEQLQEKERPIDKRRLNLSKSLAGTTPRRLEDQQNGGLKWEGQHWMTLAKDRRFRKKKEEAFTQTGSTSQRDN
ncbi:hypothetical protein EVAR_85598_1 [Eumeta japonica]|uniref:Uncharacterized protein n=1 Tax=Eumeta variegata TaxID=151549 RepID=A0A4C1XRV4_EUMVA|nr:hypothetical protein EVAR_85598_1 [Eumeta japonica]